MTSRVKETQDDTGLHNIWQYVALVNVLHSEEIPEMELVAYEKEDTLKIIEFVTSQE